jgi:hypothetical protein
MRPASIRQSHLFDKAAECERLLSLQADGPKKIALRLLRDMWIALANESTSMPAEWLSGEIASIEEMQSAALDY